MARTKQKQTPPNMETELLEPGEEMPIVKLLMKIVEAEHTIKYREPMPLPGSESAESEILLDDEEFDEDTGERPKQPSFRTKLKQKLDKAKIGGSDLLKLRIDRLPYYEANGQTGVRAEKEFMAIIPCQEEFVLTDEYLAETSKRFGASTYWFTLRHKNQIVQHWHERVGGPPVQPMASPQVENGSSGTTAFAAYPSTAPVYPQRSIKQELKDAVDMVRMVDDLRGNPEPAHQPAPQLSEEAQLASLLLTDGDIKKKAIKKLLGSDGGETDYFALAIEHGDSIINAFGTMLINVIQTVKAQTVHQQPQQPIAATPQPAQIEEPEQPTEVSPEDQLLTLVIEHCRRRAPVKVAVGRILEFADLVNEQSPVLSVDGYLDLFVEAPIESIMEYVRTLPNGEQVVALPHALAWTTDLQIQLRDALATEK